MIKSTFLAGLAVAGYLLAPVTGWAQAHAGRTCGSMQVLERQQAANPDLARKMADIEAQTRQFLANGAYMRSAASTITIPVVVHVVYANSTQNISDAQVQSQIDVLNEDYNKLNADAGQVPSAFASVAASYNINFCLAKTDPSGNASTGIVRKSTTKASFTDDDGVKSASTGGDNAWDATKYLNLWACNLGGGLLGYAQFPGGANATDGVVILYSAFGRTGTVSAPYNKGRTATHEVGHWLNLRHIWGDANCGTDYVTDTPTQQTSNYGCPTYPHVTCSNSGDMSMNYMDYTDDACMYMFTAGQYARSAALFATGGSRAGFNTSTACNSVAPPTVCAVPSGLAASNLAATSASLSWGSVNGAASYGVRYRPTGTTAWTNLTSTAASISVTGLTASTGYEAQVQSVCGGTLGNSAYSSSIVFTTTAVQAVSYCAATGGSTSDEWIASVALGLLSQTGPGRSSAGYFDYTSKSANVIIGTAATINYKNGFRSGYSSTEYWRVWVDWNQDGDFADAGEQVVSRSSSSTALLSSSFTPPATALTGKTRMRVFMKYGGYASYCTAASWGQVFDFSLNVSSSRLAAASSALETSLAPNPAADVANLTLRLPQAADATFTLVDLQGRQAWTSTASIGTDAVTVPVPVKGLAKGLYLLHITAGDARKVMKLEVE